jgi:TPR repeat protein
MYLKGLGTEQDTVKARKWLSRAADHNHDKAITRLGILSYKSVAARDTGAGSEAEKSGPETGRARESAG